MKRPLAGLLASTAAVPGAWFLLGAEEQQHPLPAMAGDGVDRAALKPSPVEQLAITWPALGTQAHAVARKPAQAVALAEPEPSPAMPSVPERKPDASEPLPELRQAAPDAPAPLPAVIAVPVVQPLPESVAAEAGPADPLPASAPVAALASVDPPATPSAVPVTTVSFTAEPVVQSTATVAVQTSKAADKITLPDRMTNPPAARPADQVQPVQLAGPENAPRPASPRAQGMPAGVTLSAFTPSAPVPAQRATAAATPKSLVETTAARTVPIGAPQPVAYPEPAFGPPEAKLVPAAFSAVEPPDQPTGLGSASSLAQAISYSYDTNPRLLAERASTRSADLGYPAARAAFGPRLDASASLSYTRDRDEILPGSFLRQQGWSDTASLILTQPLLTFGRTQAQVGQAAANIDFRRESLKLVQNEVMLDVIAAYVGTLREAGAVTIARENVALLQRQLEESSARFAVREITLADVQQVETRLALGKTGLLEAQARLGEVQARFYRAVGLPPGELAPPEPLTMPVATLAEAYSLADSNSPLVRAAQARERASRAVLAAARAESAPRVDFRGAADYGAISDYSRELRGTRVRGTVTLSVPLFDSGARSAGTGQAREANAADLQLVAAAQRDSRTAVATGWNDLLAARMSIEHYRQAVESAQRGYENAQRQERAGMRTTLDVLDLARDLLNVRNAYNAALAGEYLARANLLAALGQLDPAAMANGIKLYDPAEHFRKVRGKGDFPLLTGTLAALDGVTLPNLKADRQSPDAAHLVGTGETVTGD